MDGREGMTLQGPAASYYNNRGGFGGSVNSGPSANIHGSSGGGGGGGNGSANPQGGGGGGGVMHVPPGFKNLSNPNISLHPHVGISGGSGSAFRVENPSPNFSHGMSSMAVAPSGSRSGGETVKKKRGRPRKYVPDGAANMSLGLSPVSAATPSSERIASGERARKGRPPGTGWKQKLAPLGEWMNASAGLAFTPHVLHVGVGEDIAAKILAFAQQRSRCLCIMSGSGSVSSVTLRQPTSSGSNITFEGRFEILCLSGSYLLSESGGPRNRTGGISISVCSPDGHMIGGAIGGSLIAANPVQVVACSFVYGSAKAKNKTESGETEEKYLLEQSGEKSSASQTLTPNSGPSGWPPGLRPGIRNPEAEFDLTRG
ncbi:hypothetical protein ACP275_05G105200 [Erythranthe tilingii]